jgi:predicted ABC-type ATPase
MRLTCFFSLSHATTYSGVNGSRKTTFTLDYFKNSQATYINADLIVIGISSNTPDLSQFRVVNLCLLRLKNILKDNLTPMIFVDK